MRILPQISLLAISFICSGYLDAAEQMVPTPNPGDIRVVPVDPTPEGESIELRTMFPKKEEMQKGNSVDVQMRLDGFPLRTTSQFPRATEIMRSTNADRDGQSVHVVIDNEPYFIENEAIINSLEDTEDYFEQLLEFDIPWKLEPGMHMIRAFPTRSYGESLKGDGCFTSCTFYVKKKKPVLDVDLSKPYLTYNEPQGHYQYDATKPLLLDFYLTNILLSRDGYKVRLTVDGSTQRVLTKWIPYYVYGLGAGQHTIKLELLDEQNRAVKGLFNTIERIIQLDK